MVGLADKSCRQTVKTYYGERPLHELLERCTWHSAQHARQIIAVLERLGIKADGPLTEADYAGLAPAVGVDKEKAKQALDRVFRDMAAP